MLQGLEGILVLYGEPSEGILVWYGEPSEAQFTQERGDEPEFLEI